MKKKALLSSFLTIALCLSLIVGSTFALFTSQSELNVAVTSGNVNVVATILTDSLATSSLGVDQTAGKFANGGTADFEGAKLVLDKITPGDKASFTILMENNSDVTVQYRVKWEVDGELYDALVATADGTAIANGKSDWAVWEAPETDAEKVKTLAIAVELPEEIGNEYQGKNANIAFTVEAVQGNADVSAFDVSTWDGKTADTAWYDPAETEFVLDDAAQVAGLADLVDSGESFEGKTITLESNMDLYAEDENGNPICFDPIGSYRNDQAFKGTFDGNGHTISNLNQNTWALNNGYYYGDLGMGFFGKVEDAHIKDLKIDGASISGESGLCGVVAGAAYGDTIFENITVSNSDCADYQYYAGGIVGWASGNQQYINCNVDASNQIAAQWGDFDNSIGGVIGGCGGSSQILLKDCTVACRIDAYNDVTSTYQWYAYRRAGMLIGNTGKTAQITNENGGSTTVAAAPQLTCENVTVIYNDWANYTYCEFAGTSWPYVRVQAGVSNSAYSNPRYGHPTDANGNEVVDDNHVHNDGEDHHILCRFDQLYGGGQGVYGTATHDGVQVIYNNK